jgi:transcriptional regulator with XRE-family HTH domain
MPTTTRDPKQVAATIRRLRGERGWRQRDLAEAAGLSIRTIEALEALGHRARIVTYGRIAQAFDVPLAELLGEGE